MVHNRLELQELLQEICAHVYFQPPPTVQMQYPCIVYERDGGDVKFAGNTAYSHTKRYQVTVIDRDPDSTIPDVVEKLPLCSFERAFKADNLTHTVFTLFF